MKYLDYKEKAIHGTFDFPIEYYHINADNPNYRMMYHWHPEYEIIRIESGKMHFNLDGKDVNAEAGDIIILTDGVVHAGEPEGCVYDCLVFDLRSFVGKSRICTKQLESILENESVINMLMPKENEELNSAISTLFTAMKKKENGYELIVQGSLYCIFGIIIKEKLFFRTDRMLRRNSSQLHSFKNAIRLIEEKYSSHLTLSELAKASGMTPKYFCSFFYSMAQKTPIEYLNYYRIERACEQLSVTEQTITEITYNCGFNDVSYFTKTFKKYVGLTPHAYRKKQNSDEI